MPLVLVARAFNPVYGHGATWLKLDLIAGALLGGSVLALAEGSHADAPASECPVAERPVVGRLADDPRLRKGLPLDGQ